MMAKSMAKSMTRRAFFAFGLLVLDTRLAASGAGGEEEPKWAEFDNEMDPSTLPVVRAMLRLARVQAGDVLYDLGSGDGRIVIAANKLHGARSVGIEFNRQMVLRSLSNAEKQGAVVTILEGDVFQADFSDATVVTMFLWESVNIRLAPKLLKLQPGTRVVSHEHAMGDWKPDRTIFVEGGGDWGRRPIHLWIVPADVGGNWELTIGTKSFSVSFVQKYQRILAAPPHIIRNVQVVGQAIALDVKLDGRWRRLTGQANGRACSGIGWSGRRLD